MVFDLVAGARQRFSPQAQNSAVARPPRVLVFDSGLGGLTVFPEVKRTAEGAELIYAADDAVFPYGRLTEAALVGRVLAVMEALIGDYAPDVVVVACHTASTLVLPPLRARWPAVAFVGTVPAIKPAVAASKSRRISVLATSGTVAREYTRDLIRTYAADCAVELVGAQNLAALAEAVMRGETVADPDIRREIEPAFTREPGGRTDVIVLACTHYPLLLPRLDALAPWPVTWIDPAPAIARRVGQVLDGWVGAEREFANSAPALFTSNRAPGLPLAAFLDGCGVAWQQSPAMARLADDD